MQQGTRVRIYCDQSDRAGHTPLATAIVQLLWREHASGVTVLNAVEGFGASRQFHSARLVDLGANAPLVVEWLELPQRFDAIWPQLEPLVRHCVVTVESVDMLVGPHHGLRRLAGGATVAEVMRSEVVTVTPETALREVVARMRAGDLRFLPVVDGEGSLRGVITNGDLVSRGGLSVRLELLDAAHTEEAALAVADATAAEVMTTDLVTARPSTPLTEAAQMMVDLRLKRLPVVEQGRLAGLVSRIDLLRSVAGTVPDESVHALAQGARTAGEAAARDVPVVHPDTPVAEVLDAVVSTRLNRAVVVDDARRVLGVVSDAELLRRIGGQHQGLLDRLMRRGGDGHALHGRSAADLMHAPVTTVPRDMPLRDAIARMLQDNLKLLPVVDEQGRLHGMIDRADALRAAFPR
jgi:CBS domain-containing protein/PII-like signaling protein